MTALGLLPVVALLLAAGRSSAAAPYEFPVPVTLVGMVNLRNELVRPQDRVTFASDGTNLTFRYEGAGCTNGSADGVSLAFAQEPGGIVRHIAFDAGGTVRCRLQRDGGKWDAAWTCDGLRVTANAVRDGRWTLAATLPLASLSVTDKAIVNVMREFSGERPVFARATRGFLKKAKWGLRLTGLDRPSDESPKAWVNPYEATVYLPPNAARVKGIPSTAEFSVGGVDGVVLYYPGTNRMRVNMVEKLNVEGVKGEMPVALFGGRRLAMTKERDHYTVLTDTPVAPGRYSLSLEMGGKTFANVAAIEKTSEDWAGNSIGKSDVVLPRFEPIRVVDAETLSVVHRHYRFDGTGLPCSIVSLGREILAGAIRYEVERDGRLTDLSASGPCGLSVSASATKATVDGRAAGEDVEIRSKGGFEYDGFLWNEIELTGKGVIDRLTLVVPLKDAETPLMHAVAPDTVRFNSTGKVPAGEGVVWDGSKLLRAPPKPEDLYAPTVCPYLWFGAERRGLSVFVNDTKGLVLDSEKPAARLVRRNGVLRLEYDLINAKTPLEGVRHLSFGLEATPVKTADRALARDFQGPRALMPTNMFARTAIPFETSGFENRWARVPKDGDWTPFKAALAKARATDGGRTFKYSDPTLTWQNDEAVRSHASEWISRWIGYEGAVRTYLLPSAIDYILYRYRQWTDLGLDAIYFDDMHLIPCRNRDTAGGSFGILEMRELVKRTAVMQYEAGVKHPVLQIHMNTIVPAYAFANSLLSGEDNNPESRYEQRFSVDYVRAAVMGTQIGCEGLALDALRRQKSSKEAWAKKLPFLTRNQQAVLLPCGMRMWIRTASKVDRDAFASLMRPLADFRVWEDACAFVPFWEDDGRLGKVPDGVLASSYRRADRWLVVVGNPTEVDRTVELACGASYRNAETGEMFTDGRVTVPTGDVRLVYAEGTK